MRQFDNDVSICIEGYLFHKTCDMCPEQYDVYKNKKQVAYVRLRFGRLTVDAPKCLTKLVYEKYYPDTPYKGCFNDDEERMEELKKIVEILKRREKNGKSRNGFKRIRCN